MVEGFGLGGAGSERGLVAGHARGTPRVVGRSAATGVAAEATALLGGSLRSRGRPRVVGGRGLLLRGVAATAEATLLATAGVAAAEASATLAALTADPVDLRGRPGQRRADLVDLE